MKLKIFLILIVIFIFSCRSKKEEKAAVVKDTIENGIPLDIKVSGAIILTGVSEGKFYHPRISKNGEYLYLTTGNYKGLWVKNLKKNGLKNLTMGNGAGFRFAISDDGKEVIYRLRVRGSKKQRTQFTLLMQNAGSGRIEIFESSERRISPPALLNNQIVYFVGDKLHRKKINKSVNASNELNSFTLVNYGGIVYKITPDTFYVWRSVDKNILEAFKSPVDGRIVYEVRGKGIFIEDEKGNEKFIVKGRNPRWSPDGKIIVFTKEKSDGMRIIANEIQFAIINPLKIIQTEIEGENPVWMPDGKHIIYSDADGKIIKQEIKVTYKEVK